MDSQLVQMLPESQGCTDDIVLYFNPVARPTELYEAATYRLDACRHLLDALSGSTTNGGDRELSAVAGAASLLLHDANSMMAGIYNMLRELEQLRKENQPLRMVKPTGRNN